MERAEHLDVRVAGEQPRGKARAPGRWLARTGQRLQACRPAAPRVAAEQQLLPMARTETRPLFGRAGVPVVAPQAELPGAGRRRD